MSRAIARGCAPWSDEAMPPAAKVPSLSSRLCRHCQRPLSRYNPNLLCHPCLIEARSRPATGAICPICHGPKGLLSDRCQDCYTSRGHRLSPCPRCGGVKYHSSALCNPCRRLVGPHGWPE